VVHVLGQFGKLPGAGHGGGGNEERRRNLGIAMPGGVQVQHELDQGPGQAGARTGQQGKSRAGHARGARKIKQSKRLAQRHVVLGGEIEMPLLAPFADDNIARGIFAHRHAGMRQIRNGQQEPALLVLDGAHIGV